LNLTGIDRNFGNAYLQTWTLGLEDQIGKLTADIAYVGTASVHLPRITFPNAYSGATQQFAQYTKFDNSGNAIGGFGTEQLITATAHSNYNALQASLTGTPFVGGPASRSATRMQNLSTTQAASPQMEILPVQSPAPTHKIPSTPTPKRAPPAST